MATTTTTSAPAVASVNTRWGHLAICIICMVMIANLQYGWTLFVNPIDQKYHWGRAAIQVAFTIFVLTETWLVPVEGWLVDKFGPRVMVCGSAASWSRIALGHQFCRRLAAVLYVGAAIGGIGAGVGLRHLRRQRAEMVPRPARAVRPADGGRLRRRLGADRHPDRTT